MPDNLDDILTRLAKALEGSAGSTGVIPPATGSGSVSSGSAGTGGNGSGVATPDMTAFREMLATELAYLQSIPPLTDDIIMELDEYFANFPEQLKALKNRPLLSMQMQALTPTASNGSGGDRMFINFPSSLIIKLIEEAIKNATTTRPQTSAERSEERTEDPELVALGTQMARDISGVTEERLLPIAALAIGAAVAALVGGVTVGRAVHEANR